MRILALEFSSRRRAAAIVQMAGGRSSVLAQIADEDFRGKTGPMLMNEVLERTRLSPDEIDRIGVGLGPGSYTGIRSSLAIAQGWHLGRGTGVVGISTVELLARQCARTELANTVQIVIDAQRKEVYSAVYQISGGEPKVMRELEIVSQEALRPAPGTTILGPEASRFHPGAKDFFPDPVLLAELAANQSPVPPENLQPIYLRPTTFVKAPPPRRI